MKKWLVLVSAVFVACGGTSTQNPQPADVSLPPSTPAQEPSGEPAKASPAPSAGASATAAEEPYLMESDNPEFKSYNIELRKILHADPQVKKICAGGWTGDSFIKIRSNAIESFEIFQGNPDDPATPIAGVKGKKVPAPPASLQKRYESGVTISICI